MDKKAALYIRVSTDIQAEEGYSIEAQKEQLKASCVSKGIKNYEYYIDAGWTGSNTDRPEFQRMIDDIKKDKISHCFVYKLDRLSRSQKDTLHTIEDIFIPNNVVFNSLTESLDTSTPTGMMMIGILSAFAQLERETIKLRTRMGMKERVKKGFWMGGGRIPFGYDYDPRQGVLVPNKDAEKVRKIYDLFLQGYSLQSIANMLGLKYEKLASQILKRKSNTGIIKYKGEEYKGKHEGIISEEIYNRAMIELERRSKVFTGGNKLLTGLLYCGHCGGKMRYQKWGNNGDKIVCYSTYKSNLTGKSYLVKDENCTQKALWVEPIEKAVIEDLFSLSVKNIPIKKTSSYDTLNILYSEKANLENKIKRLYNLYAEQNEELLLDTINENKEKLQKLLKQIETEKKYHIKEEQKNTAMGYLNNIEGMWGKATMHEKKTIIRCLVDRIIVTDENIKIIYKI